MSWQKTTPEPQLPAILWVSPKKKCIVQSISKMIRRKDRHHNNMLKYFITGIIFHNTELKSRHSITLISSEKLSQLNE